MIIDALETGTVEWAPAPPPPTMKDVCDAYDRQRAEIVRRWESLPAARWDGALAFFGRQRPASPMAWSFLFDIVHHRGQITTYLRPMGSTVRPASALESRPAVDTMRYAKIDWPSLVVGFAILPQVGQTQSAPAARRSRRRRRGRRFGAERPQGSANTEQDRRVRSYNRSERRCCS